MYVGGAWWEFCLLDGWQVTEDAECLTLTRSELGAFQLSAAVKTHGLVTPGEVEAQSRKGTPDTARPITFEAGTFSGFTAGYELESSYWQRFWLAHGNVLVFATYNGAPEAWRAERAEVYSMLATLRLRSSTNALPA